MIFYPKKRIFPHKSYYTACPADHGTTDDEVIRVEKTSRTYEANIFIRRAVFGKNSFGCESV